MVKRLPRSRLLSKDINQEVPTPGEILECLGCMHESLRTSYPEIDGVIRDARAGRDLICLEAAIEIVKRSTKR